MQTILVSLEDGARREDIIASAWHLAAFMDANLRVVDFGRDDRLGLRTFEEHSEADGVIAVVLAAPEGVLRYPTQRSIATNALLRCRRPVVVVPRRPILRTIHRILLPLDGSEACSAPVRTLLSDYVDESSVSILHVFTTQTAPRMLDRPEYDLPEWGRTFVDRLLSGTSACFEWKTGDPCTAISAACDGHHGDIVALAWSQSATRSRSQVVRAVIERSRLPIMLLPVAPTALDLRGEIDLRQPEPTLQRHVLESAHRRQDHAELVTADARGNVGRAEAPGALPVAGS